MSDFLDNIRHEPTTRTNKLYYGDNLTIMQNHMPSSSVDLIYLDPPFNSDRTYNLIYKQLTGMPLPEQEEAFVDTWTLDAEKEELVRRMPIVLREYGCDEQLVQFWQAWVNALRSTNSRLLAYLVYMTYRLFEMRRILKPTGSIYLHCDSTASHYIKVMMDSVFHASNFRNEIIWKRQSAHSDAKTKFPAVSDTILFYGASKATKFHPQYGEHDPVYVDKFYRHDDGDGRGMYRLGDMSAPKGGGMAAINKKTGKPNGWYIYKGYEPSTTGWRYSLETMERLDSEGRINFPLNKDGSPAHSKRLALKRYLAEQEGSIITNIWADINSLGAGGERGESLGYPTQKPIALLDRIIRASTEEGDVVFDPFCGCGTAVYAAHLANRRWVGCDIAILSIRIVRDVLLKRYGLKEGEHYEVSGVPVSVEGAQDLFDRDPRQFQHWVVEMAGGFANKQHSGDKGVDGRIYFETSEGLRNMVISVKGGKLTPAYVRELRGTLARDEGTEMAGFICLQKPTKGMLQEAATAGMYTYLDEDYERVQIRTVDDLLNGQPFVTPSRIGTLHREKQAELALSGSSKKDSSNRRARQV